MVFHEEICRLWGISMSAPNQPLAQWKAKTFVSFSPDDEKRVQFGEKI
jgi:hypothetical protein